MTHGHVHGRQAQVSAEKQKRREAERSRLVGRGETELRLLLEERDTLEHRVGKLEDAIRQKQEMLKEAQVRRGSPSQPALPSTRVQAWTPARERTRDPRVKV